MSNNQMIGKCWWCGQYYCQECSDHEGKEGFCSKICKELADLDKLPPIKNKFTKKKKKTRKTK